MKRLWTIVIIAALALGLAGCGSKSTPVATGPYNVSGRVYQPVKNPDDGSQAGFAGVEVVATTSSGAVKTTTGPDGTYTFTGLTGMATITVAAPDGWGPVSPSQRKVSAAATGQDFVAGRPVMFVSDRETRNGFTQVFLMNPDGSNQQPLFSTFDGRWHLYPQLSPDGTRVAFTASDGSFPGLYLADLAGGEPQKVTDLPTDDVAPTWLPDGQSILYAVRPGYGESSGLFLVEAGPDKSPTRLAEKIPGTSLVPSRASLSPDGTQLICESEGGIYLLDYPIDGKDATLLGSVTAPVWSPAGNQIAYLLNNSEDTQLTIYVRDLGATTATRLLSGSIDSVSWSADGRLIYYAGWDQEGAQSDIFSVKAAGGGPTQLTDDPGYDGL